MPVARQKLSREEHNVRVRAGWQRWARRVDARIDALFAEMDEDGRGLHDPAEFAARYHHTYGERFPLIYARTTEFGERFGSKMTWEDIRGGSYTPHGEGRSIEEQIEEHERWLAEQETPFCPVCKVARVKNHRSAKTCGAPACKVEFKRRMNSQWLKNNPAAAAAASARYRAKHPVAAAAASARHKAKKQAAKKAEFERQRRHGFGIPFGQPIISYGSKNSAYESYVFFAVRLGISPLTEERWRLLAA